MTYLANMYYDQGRYDDAESLYEKALAIREKTLGGNHPFVAVSLDNLANLYYQQGRLDEAEPLYMRALDIREQNRKEESAKVKEKEEAE